MKLLSCVMTVSLAACTVGPKFVQPEPEYEQNWINKTANTEQVISEWWKVFGDPMLEKMIQKAASANHDIRIAAARVREARAARGGAGAGGLPKLNTGLSVVRNRASKNGPGGLGELVDAGLADLEQFVYNAGFDARWEIDIFGAHRAKAHAAEARIAAAVNSRRDVLITVFAELARNYMELRGNQKRLHIISRNVGYQQETLAIVKGRYQIGLSHELDVTRAKAQLEQTRALIPATRSKIRAGVYRLAVLTGQPPEALFDKLMLSKPLPIEPDVVPVGLRSDLLLRRADLRAATASLKASLADIGVAEADLYPKFFLTGAVGLEAVTLGSIVSLASGAWSLGSLIQWPIFRGGEIRANIRVHEARAEQAALRYEQAVFAILEEVESNLTAYSEELQTRARLKEAVAATRHASKMVNGLYRQGLSNFIDVLDADSRLTQAEDALVQSETRTLIRLIALYKALGGGWEIMEYAE